jgi:hypothetical protein
MTISLDAAIAMLDRGREHATVIGVPMNLAVTDGGGHTFVSNAGPLTADRWSRSRSSWCVAPSRPTSFPTSS